MQLRNHIAHRFLTDAKMTDEILKSFIPDVLKTLNGVDMTQYTVLGENNKFKEAEKTYRTWYNLLAIPMAIPHVQHNAYYVTKTVQDDLDLIKFNKGSLGYDWTIFKNVPECKKTFIFDKDAVFRIHVIGQLITMFYLRDRLKPQASFIWIDRFTNEKHHAFDRELLKSTDEITLMRLLAFYYFAENETRIVNPGKSYGTKKQPDALDNSTDIPVTIINSNWNVTSIRLDGFDVSGHLRLQPCGPSSKERKLIFIEPFKKHGYVRKATKVA
jgi:hypothetical protein